MNWYCNQHARWMFHYLVVDEQDSELSEEAILLRLHLGF